MAAMLPTEFADLEPFAAKWSLPTDGCGDCEDYVLLKRKMLIDGLEYDGTTFKDWGRVLLSHSR